MDCDKGLGITVDWAAIGFELRRAGFGATKVAYCLNLPRATVRFWFERGGHPRYVDGLCLIRLHALVVGGIPPHGDARARFDARPCLTILPPQAV